MVNCNCFVGAPERTSLLRKSWHFQNVLFSLCMWILEDHILICSERGNRCVPVFYAALSSHWLNTRTWKVQIHALINWNFQTISTCCLKFRNLKRFVTVQILVSVSWEWNGFAEQGKLQQSFLGVGVRWLRHTWQVGCLDGVLLLSLLSPQSPSGCNRVQTSVVQLLFL